MLRDSIWEEKIYADIFYNGFDGIKTVKDNKYHLVVLDIIMTGITEFEVLKKIRTLSNVPILMLTAKDDSESKVKGLCLDADDYLAKPFNA